MIKKLQTGVLTGYKPANFSQGKSTFLMLRNSQKLSDFQDAEPMKYAFLFRIHPKPIKPSLSGQKIPDEAVVASTRNPSSQPGEVVAVLCGGVVQKNRIG